MTEILDILVSRRSVRSYTNRPLESDIMCKLLKAAKSAPQPALGIHHHH